MGIAIDPLRPVPGPLVRKAGLKKVILREFAYELIYSPKKGSKDRTRSRIDWKEIVFLKKLDTRSMAEIFAEGEVNIVLHMYV